MAGLYSLLNRLVASADISLDKTMKSRRSSTLSEISFALTFAAAIFCFTVIYLYRLNYTAV